MKLNSPSDIYEIVLSEINNLIHSLKTETADDEIRNFQEDAQRQLEDVLIELSDSLKSLQLNAEWDVFSIAFYGETNAGKSTLIEILRILLKEPTKKKEREEFKKIKASIKDIQNQIDQYEKLLEQTNNDYQLRIMEIEENINTINTEQSENEAKTDELHEHIHDIENLIKVKRKSSVSNFFKALLAILEEQQEHRLILKNISSYKTKNISLENKKSELKKLHERTKEEWDTKTKSIKVSVEILNNEIIQISDKLSEYSDGKIIGDGHSDFTRKVTTYQFESCEQKFALLDLPGIEGKEDLVINEIKDAVQKAHAVFYITSKPTPPQTGNDQSEGTLEKIKKHLGQQTEVYSIFNKRIKNYQQLQPGLINDDEKDSLKELDVIMRDELGGQYETHIILSAYPAFLSVANCTQDNFEKAQVKFLEKFDSPKSLLQASLVENFSDWITIKLVKNCKAKIIRSNYKKVSKALKRTNCDINSIHERLYNLETKLIKTKKATDNQLDEAAEILKQQLDSDAYKEVADFKTLLRKNVYCDIDKELNNDELKKSFECRKNEAIKILSINLEEKFSITIEEFKNDITGIVEKFDRYSAELLNAYKNSTKFDFDFTPDLEIKSGISLVGLISSIIGSISGAILCITNTVGWVILILSILGAAISIGKEVLGFLDHKYRSSQQKKASDDNIEKIGDNILESLLSNLKEAHNPLQEGISAIKVELLKSISEIKLINQVFCSAEAKLVLLIESVDKEGVNLDANK